LIVYFVFICSALGQIKTKYKTYNQKNFEKNKIFENTYHLWWSKDKWGPIVKDTIPYFVDDRNYKGIINYGVEFHSKDFRVFDFSEGKTMYFFKVHFQSCKFNSNDSILEIEGFITGGWGDIAKYGKNEPKNYIDVFIGEKTDTITPCYYNIYVNKDKVETKWNNEIIESGHVLDTFPSFYFKNPTYNRLASKGKRPFKIKAKINKNSILAFGGSGCYSEIFDIGSMIYLPNKNRKNKIKIKKYKEFEQILINNKLVADIEKEKAAFKEINYYTYTEKAENYILRRQYANAKETYLILDKEYPTLFARDIHNAIRCAVLSRDNKNAFFWGEKLAHKGINNKYFDATIFSNLKKNLDWEKFRTRFDSISKEAKKRINLNLRLQLEQLLEEDQSDYGLENRKEPKILYETTVRVTDKLIELLKNEGYPSEEKIGVYTKNDTILNFSPSYNVLIRHAIQQKPKNLDILQKLLDKSIDSLEYDSKRSPNNIFLHNSCFHIYKGNLYNSKSCGANDLMIKKMKFIFNNPNNFIIFNNNYVVTEYNKENPEEYDKYYNENYNFIMKLTDNWEFYMEE
tara:strand:- start:897 stop:2609 length:1713 start_codon:yes stop_codon:yes gene_type:complete